MAHGSYRSFLAASIIAAACTFGPSAFAGSPFDGTYSGQSPVVGTVSTNCNEYHLNIVVKDGHFNANVLSEPFSVDIGADGAFSSTALRPGGKGGTGYMTGKISGDTLDVEYHAADCAHHAILKRPRAFFPQ